MEASDVFRIAGVDSPLLEDAEAVQLDEAQQVEAARLQQEMEDWRNKREATLEKLVLLPSPCVRADEEDCPGSPLHRQELTIAVWRARKPTALANHISRHLKLRASCSALTTRRS